MNVRKLRRIISLGVAAALGIGGASVAAEEQRPVTILLDEYPLPFPVAPIIVDGTTMVPFRAIAEALGITVEWNGETRTIRANDAETGTVVDLTLGSKRAAVNGEAAELRVAPMSVEGSTLIPLSFFSQRFGAAVSWDGATRTVVIDSPPRDLEALAFYAMSSFRERAMIAPFDSVAFGWGRIDEASQFTLEGKDFYWPDDAADATAQSIVDGVSAGGKTSYFMAFASDAHGELTRVLEDEKLAATTIDAIVGTASSRSFEGVLLDFEGLGLTGDPEAVQAQYNAFVSELAAKADQAGLKLAIAVHPPNGAYLGYDYKTLATYADELIVMAYAYEGEKAPEPMNRVDEAIRRLLPDVPEGKLLLGISMGSETAASVDAKIGLAKRYGLRGIAVWRLGLLGAEAFEEIRDELVP